MKAAIILGVALLAVTATTGMPFVGNYGGGGLVDNIVGSVLGAPASGSYQVHQVVDDAYEPENIIGNVPTLRCAPGSKRDILGNCRRTTVIDFS